MNQRENQSDGLLRYFFIFVFLFSVITGCGKGKKDGMVEATLLTNLGHGLNPKIFNLQENLTDSVAPFVAAVNCIQPSVFSGIKVGPNIGNNLSIDTFPVPFRSNTPSTTVSTFSALANYSTIEKPIVISVPQGKSIEFGVAGVFYLPQDSNSDGICDPVGTGAYTLIGHTVSKLSASGTVPLNVWAVPAAVPQSTPSNGSYGAFTCSDPNDSSRCSFRDIVQATWVGTATLNVLAIHYFFGKNGGGHPVIQFQTQPTHVYVPHLFPFIVNFTLGGTAFSTLILGKGITTFTDPNNASNVATFDFAELKP